MKWNNSNANSATNSTRSISKPETEHNIEQFATNIQLKTQLFRFFTSPRFCFSNLHLTLFVGRAAQSVEGMATGLDGLGIESRWEARFSAPVQTCPGAHPASCTMGTGSFPGVKSGRGVTLTPHPLLVASSWKGRAIPLLPLWAVRLVQSLSACTRVHFTVRPVQSFSACTRVHFTVRPVQSLSACTRVHFTYLYLTIAA
jgi:hypothetical protein